VTAPTSWPLLLSALLRGESLSASETAWAMTEVMSGEASPAQVAAFAVALRAKGETAEEVAGLVEVMLAHSTPVQVAGPVLDTVGTGGDRAHTVNLSTMSTLVVAATGARVVKHGNRAASSSCGSADLLEELGVVIDLQPDGVTRCVEEVGVGFCFAPVFHPALRHAAAPRREMGIPTVFNFLGPLTNPARPSAQAVGCADLRMAPVMAGVLAARGISALVFRGEDGLDELTTASTTRIWLVEGGEVTETVLDASALGLPRIDISELRGADAAFNAAVARDVLAGKGGPVRDAVLLNAAAGLVALGEPSADSLEADLSAGIEQCAKAIDSGAAAETLARWVDVSRAASGRIS
jgi:anthranilate phosphoribosyltransferase